jgi:hypothetical protein
MKQNQNKNQNQNKEEKKNEKNKSNNKDAQKEQMNPEDIYAGINHKYFSESLLKLVDLIEDKSKEIIEATKASYDSNSQPEPDFKKTNKYKNHQQLQNQCQALRNGFSGKIKDFDQGKVIKKVYKMLTQNMDKFFPDQNLELFQLKEKDGAFVTIIPGVIMNLVVKNASPEFMNQLWGNLYMLYISAANLINYVNKSKKDEKILELIKNMQAKVVEMGIIKQDELFNPFVGLNAETGEYNVEQMFANIENAPEGENMSMDSVLKMSGIDKMFDMKELSKQLKDIKDDEINEATEKITGLLGAKGDNDISEVCHELITNIVHDLKNDQSGNLNMFEIAQSVAKKVGGNMKKDKFSKTANQFNKFMENSQDKLKDLKDDKGNPIGDKFLNGVNIPMQLMQMMSKGNMIPKKK